MSDRTVYSLLEEAVEKFGTKPALYQPRPGKKDDKYQIYNWIDYKQAAEEIAAGLRRLGVKKGDIVGIDAETRAEFYLADLGIMVSGCVSAAVYTSYPAENLVSTFRAANAKVVFVENSKMLEALQAAADEPEPVSVPPEIDHFQVPSAEIKDQAGPLRDEPAGSFHEKRRLLLGAQDSHGDFFLLVEPI